MSNGDRDEIKAKATISTMDENTAIEVSGVSGNVVKASDVTSTGVNEDEQAGMSSEPICLLTRIGEKWLHGWNLRDRGKNLKKIQDHEDRSKNPSHSTTMTWLK